MSDPRNTDPYRRSGLRGADQAGFWPWLTAALTAFGLLLGGLLGYNWGYDNGKSAQLSPPTTTGSAPSQQRAPANR
jgi:hypothetical protein